MTPDYQGLACALAPESALIVGALAAIGVDLTAARRLDSGARLRIAAAVGVAATLVALCLAIHQGVPGPIFGGVLIIDPLARIARIGVLGLTAIVLGASTASKTKSPAEYVAVVLFAAAGFALMAAAQQLLLAFLALELASVSLYVLAGFDRSRPESAEAALKYFLCGAMSAAFLLFGFSLLYGLSGTIEAPGIAIALAAAGPSPLLAVALVMVLVAFGFKAAAAPFHLWAPDAYQGAPAPSAGLIASGSKLAGFVLFLRLLWPGLGGSAATAALPGWIPVAALVSGASLLLGNLAALAQSDFRRLLAYSAIAHSGALVLGVIVAGAAGPGPLAYYALTYGIATAGAFGVIGAIEGAGGGTRIADLAGLRQRSPFLAACLAVFVLSLAGIPPLAGFFGKVFVFAAALRQGGPASIPGGLAVLAILLSAVALYYYLYALKQALVAPPATDARPISVPWPAVLAIAVAATAIVLLGLFPSLVFSANQR